MTSLHLALLTCLLLFVGQPAAAQHCAPVYDSYLSEVSLERPEGRLELHAEYTLNGGREQDTYQAYVLAFLERDAARVMAPGHDGSIGPDAAVVLHTQLIERNEDGVFVLEHAIDQDELAKRMIAHGKLGERDRVVNGGWGAYRDRVRLAVFVPWLDDETHSVLDGLPEDRHCCNYGDADELLFQTLPWRLKIGFGIVKARGVEDGTFVIEVSGDRTPSGTWPPPIEPEAEEPASLALAEERLAEGLADCTEVQRRLFRLIRVKPATGRSEYADHTGPVWIVGRIGERVLWYEDIHGTFELHAPDADGVLRPDDLGQSGLRRLLQDLLDQQG